MLIDIECLYCGYKWVKEVYSAHSAEHLTCTVCGDLNLKVKDLSVSKIDYYKGSPVFLEDARKEEDQGWPWREE